jgi:DNA-binding NarL/FixJ family response regulator
MSTVKILLADDHQMFIDGLSMLISNMPGVELVATASNGAEVLHILTHTPCDLVILDVHMPVMDGIEATKQIKLLHPSIQVIALSMTEDPEVIRQLVYAGASGYIPKNTNKNELQLAITRVMQGESYLNEAFVPNKLENGHITIKRANEPMRLTDREVEILCQICCEKSNQEIADQLFISPKTVETHRKNLIKKLKVKNSMGLVKIALRHGLIDLKQE